MQTAVPVAAAVGITGGAFLNVLFDAWPALAANAPMLNKLVAGAVELATPGPTGVGLGAFERSVTAGTLEDALIPNNLSHVFGNPGHGLGPLVSAMGDADAVVRGVVSELKSGRAAVYSLEAL